MTQSLTDMRECRHGPKANCHKCLIPELVGVLEDCATALHADRMHDGRFWDCDRWGCGAARALIEKAKLVDPDCEAS